MESGAVTSIVQLLSNPLAPLGEVSAWAFGNIARISLSCRDLVLQAGAMQPLLMQMDNTNLLTLLRTATWALSTLCRADPQLDLEVFRPALPTLARSIRHPKKIVSTNACWALSYLSHVSAMDKIQAIVDSEAGVCGRWVELLRDPSPAVQAPAHYIAAVGQASLLPRSPCSTIGFQACSAPAESP